MPLLVHAELRRDAARPVVPQRGAPAGGVRPASGACRGASRSPASTSWTATATTSTRRSACRASGLKRGLGDDLVVAPYATALAAMVDPTRAAQNFRRLAREGAEGAYGFYEAIDYTHRKAPDSDAAAAPPARCGAAGRRRAGLPGPPPGDEPGRARQHPARRRDGAPLPRRSAGAGHGAAAAGAGAAARARSPSRVPPRRRASPRRSRAGGGAPVPVAAHPLSRTRSSCRTARMSPWSPTPVAAPASAAAARSPATARTPPATSAASSSTSATCAAGRCGRPPTTRRAASRRSTSSRSSRSARCSAGRDDGIATQLDIAVSTEDDVEVRRLAVTNLSDRPRELEITSYGEIALASLADDLAHPAFGKLFVETEYLPESAALLCAPPAARRRRRRGMWAVHVLSVEGRMQGPVEWETDRLRFLGRGRGPEDPVALDGRALSGTTGAVLDPDREPAAAHPAGARAASCASRSRPGWPRAARARWPSRTSTTTRARRPAPSRSPSPRPRARCATWASRATRRSSTSASPRACSTPTARSAPHRRRSSRNDAGPARASGRTAFRATCRSSSCAWSRRTTSRWSARCCRRRSTGGSRDSAPTSSSSTSTR